MQTVEHVLSALAGLGVTDAILGLSGPEIPIGDGSANEITQALMAAGFTDLCGVGFPAPRPIEIRQPILVQEGQASILAEPLVGAPDGVVCVMVYELDYGGAGPIPVQSASLTVVAGQGVPGYASEVATARTFCLVEEAQAMRKMGLFTKFEPKDLLVIGADGPIDNSYRFPNEPARHKLLDLLGDLSLAGRPIHGRITATRSGHSLNHQMARALAALA